LRYFSKREITAEQIEVLIESRKIIVKDKIINHNGNFVEHVNMEHGLKVLPENDLILEQIRRHLIPCLEDFWLEDFQLNNYRFNDLPRELKRYMLDKDSLFFSFWCKRVTYRPSIDQFDRMEERLERMIPDYTEGQYARHVINGQAIPTSLGKKAKDSARRSYKTVNSLIKSNIHLFKNFVTFTFAIGEHSGKYQKMNRERNKGEYDLQFEYVDAKDFELAKNAFTRAMFNLSRRLKRKGISLEYIAVWELQKNGNYHFHMLCSEIPQNELYKVPDWLDYDFRNHRKNDGYGLKEWRFGKSDIQEIKSPEKITTYVSKYIIKSFLCVSEDHYESYLNKKKYFPSKGLERSESKYFVSDTELEKEFRKLELLDKIAFEREYINPYNDSKITNKIYTFVEKGN
jgi:hypothetical protein